MSVRFLPLAVFFIMALLVAIPLWQGGAPPPPDVMTGRAVPLTVIDGIDPALLQDGAVLVNFFASWCVPCAVEQPVLAQIRVENTVPMLGIVYKDTPEAIAAWLDKHGNPFHVVGWDQTGAAAIDWGVYGVPETYLVIDGILRWRHVGPLDAATYRRDLLPLLQAKGAG